jgi:hypothetical protein
MGAMFLADPVIEQNGNNARAAVAHADAWPICGTAS